MREGQTCAVPLEEAEHSRRRCWTADCQRTARVADWKGWHYCVGCAWLLLWRQIAERKFTGPQWWGNLLVAVKGLRPR